MEMAIVIETTISIEHMHCIKIANRTAIAIIRFMVFDTFRTFIVSFTD